METEHSHEDLLPFNFHNVTEKFKKIAEEELNEKESEVEDTLNALKDLQKKEKDFNPCLDDAFLLMFLRSRKFNVSAAANKIKSYYSVRVKYPSMYKNFTPKSCLKVLKSNIHYFLPHRSFDGCAILLSKFGLWDPKLTTCEELLKFNLVCNEMAIQNPVTQVCGVITIADMKGFSWSHLLQIHVADIKCFVRTLQDCLPIRHKAIHIINNPGIFRILFAMVRPLLSLKLANRIHIHGYDMSNLHQHVPPCLLPQEFGGTLGPFKNYTFYESLLQSEEHFIEQQKYGYITKNEH